MKTLNNFALFGVLMKIAKECEKQGKDFTFKIVCHTAEVNGRYSVWIDLSGAIAVQAKSGYYGYRNNVDLTVSHAVETW